MRAILLSAGRGTRLMPLTRNTPKALLDLGHGITVVESQLASIREVGIKDVCLVLGYLADQVEAKVRRFDGLNVEFVFNPFFDLANNLVSLWMARHQMGEEFISINGDDVFHPSVLSALLSASHPPDITMVIDKKPAYVAEDMKVTIRNGTIRSVSKQIPPDQADGESIGIIRYTGSGVLVMKRVLDEMVRIPEGLQVFYLAAIQRLVDSGVPVGFVEVDPSLWAEVDFHPDLELLRNNVLRIADTLIVKAGSVRA